MGLCVTSEGAISWRGLSDLCVWGGGCGVEGSCVVVAVVGVAGGATEMPGAL